MGRALWGGRIGVSLLFRGTGPMVESGGALGARLFFLFFRTANFWSYHRTSLPPPPPRPRRVPMLPTFETCTAPFLSQISPKTQRGQPPLLEN